MAAAAPKATNHVGASRTRKSEATAAPPAPKAETSARRGYSASRGSRGEALTESSEEVIVLQRQIEIHAVRDLAFDLHRVARQPLVACGLGFGERLARHEGRRDAL